MKNHKSNAVHEQLMAMNAICSGLGAEVKWGSDAEYLTAWYPDALQQNTAKIQAEIKAHAAKFPNIVCFSLDYQCTLIYAI